MPSPSLPAFDFDQLSLTDVARHYGRRRALSGITLTLRAGELIGLLGPNGAGKSTLLGVLATLIRPSRGQVTYGGQPASGGAVSLRANIGFLSHDLQLYAELTARENLEFFAGLYGLDDPTACAGHALATAGLEARGDDLVQGFSRGMRQRLALERALLHDPRLILLDEPFTGLDESSSRALAERLRVLRGDGRMVLLATHDIETVEGLLDRALVIDSGKLVTLEEDGLPLRERYRRALGLTSPP